MKFRLPVVFSLIFVSLSTSLFALGLMEKKYKKCTADVAESMKQKTISVQPLWRDCQETILAKPDGYQQHAICTTVSGQQFDVAVRRHVQP